MSETEFGLKYLLGYFGGVVCAIVGGIAAWNLAPPDSTGWQYVVLMWIGAFSGIVIASTLSQYLLFGKPSRTGFNGLVVMGLIGVGVPAVIYLIT